MNACSYVNIFWWRAELQDSAKIWGTRSIVVPIQIETPSANIDKLRDKVIDVYGLRYDLVLALDI